MRPPVPAEFYEQNKELPIEGMMFVGDKGIIMSSEFNVREPYVLSGDVKLAEDLKIDDPFIQVSGIKRFIDAVKSGEQLPGSFREAWPITEAVNLYAAALRSGKNLKYDAQKREITNASDANFYLTREYRKGWGLEEI